MIYCWTDSLCEPHNPNGVVTYGIVIDFDKEHHVEFQGFIGVGEGMSNNVGEFKAVSIALSYLLSVGYAAEDIRLHTDSQLVANQLNKEWRVKGGEYLEYYYEARALVENFTNLSIVWVPREQNKMADKLAQIAYREYCNHNNLPYKFNSHRRKGRNKYRHKR